MQSRPLIWSRSGPAAWKREDLEGTTDWIRPLSRVTLSELTAAAPLRTDDITALIALHTIVENRALSFRFDLVEGDVLFLNDHAVIHARSAFDECAEPRRRRHLMRMWLKFSDD